jgi:gamma-glutamylcyclotransferase (GGCT)/AIG2-like uncharacterized protein YtfP
MRSGAGGEHRLAAYGSLRPGARHHDLVAELEVLGGGTIRGELTDCDGYPMLTLDPDGDVVAVVVFGGVTGAKWAELDVFEGPAYRRTLVDVELGPGRSMIATCYVAVGDRGPNGP